MNRLKLLSVTFLALLVASPRVSHSQTTVNSDPVGFVTTTINAGARSNSITLSTISPVLLRPSGITTGPISGTLASVASNTVTVSSGGWSNNALISTNPGPNYLMLTGGNQKGLITRITANTSNTLTLDTFGLSLSSLVGSNQITAGDTYRIVAGDTLLSFFGTTSNGVVGGTQTQFLNNLTDQVITTDANGDLQTYYFNTDFNQWRRSGLAANQGSTPLPPVAGALYRRFGTTPLTYIRTGTVPVQLVRFIIRGNKSTFLGRFFPADGATLLGLGLQSLPGWTINDDRLVAMDTGGGLWTYTWNGTQWRRAGLSSSANAVPIPVGRAVYTLRTGKTPAILPVNLPYSL